MSTTDKTALAAELRDACTKIRVKASIPLSALIPIMQRAADFIDRIPDGKVVALPRIPTAEMLSVIRNEEWPADWDSGKRLQREVGLDVVAPECSTEVAAGQYLRLIALGTAPTPPAASVGVAEAQLPDVSELLVWAVTDELVGMSKIMNTDFQDALVAYSKRILALATPTAPAAEAPARPQPLKPERIEKIARAHGTGGWQTLGDMAKFARAIESEHGITGDTQ
jgi:hypothetical protein